MQPMEELEFFGCQPTRVAGGVEHTKRLLSFNQAQSKINKEINRLAHPVKPAPSGAENDSLRPSMSREPKPPLIMVNPPADLASMLNKRMLAPPMQSYQKERQHSRERERRRQQQKNVPQPPGMCPDTTDNLRIRERQLNLPTVEQSLMTQNSVQQVASFDKALEYLQQAQGSSRAGAVGGKALFLHVTPRFNVDPTVINKNFYDLAILEKPGSATSGFVWARAGVHYHSSAALGRYDLMQLSAKGLLYSEQNELGDGTVSTFVPVSEFIAERKKFRKVNALKFFGHFRELKFFTAWKLLHRSRKVKRASLHLQQHSWFSHEVFVKIYLYIVSACYDLERTIEICHFNPNGGNMNVMEFIVAQIERVRTVVAPAYAQKVNDIIAFIHKKYSETTSAQHLMGVLAASGVVPKAKKASTGPADRSAADESEQEFDLMFRRELEFLKQKVFKRMQYLVQLFQRRLNAAAAKVMLGFWGRFTELLRGIRRVSVNSSKPMGYWDSNVSEYEVFPYHHHHHHGHVPHHRHHHHHDGQHHHHEHQPGVHHYHKVSHDTRASNFQQYLLYSSLDLDRELIDLPSGSSLNHRFVVKRSGHNKGEAELSHENSDGHYNFSVHGPVNVTKLYEDEGVHLSVDLIMSDSSLASHVEMAELVGDERPHDHHVADIFKSVLDVCKMKAILFPSRAQLFKSMDELLACLNDFLEGIPDALHILLPLMAKGEDEDADGAEFEFEEEEKINQVRIDSVSQGMATAESSPYFKCLLQVYSLRHSGMIEITVANLKVLQDAYKELSSLDRRQAQLQDTYKRLLSLHPTVLATQLNSSLALPKVRTMIELSPAEVDDLQRCEERDMGRLEALTHALEYLELSKQKVGHWRNIKHHRGIVSSFYYCNEQINRFRDLQMTNLYATLPHAFVKRIKLVLGFMQQMERVFDLSGADLNGIIAMLTKLKNFDTAHHSFDREIEIIKELHHILHNHLANSHVTSEAAHQEALKASYVGRVVGNQKGVISFAAAKVDHVFTARAYTTADMLFKQCMNMYATMMSNISKCRLLLGSQLPQIKKEILVDCELLRGTITKCTDLLHEFNGMTVGKRRGADLDEASHDPTFKNCSQLRTLGPEIEKAKVKAQRLVVMQTMLAEAHDIVGLGSEFFSKQDIDSFDSMNKVVIEYRLHSVAWESVLEAKTIQRKLMASKLAASDCVIYQRRVVDLQQACERILQQQKHLLMVDESKIHTKPGQRRAPPGQKAKKESTAVQETLIASQMLHDIIAQLGPRLECTIYLSFVGLQYHHWKEISDDIFSLCRLQLTVPVDPKDPSLGIAAQKALEMQPPERLSHAEVMRTVTVQDVTSKAHPMQVGILGETSVATLVHRGISKYNNGVREIVAESVVEFLIGEVLEQTESTLQSAVLKFSADWLRLGQRAGGIEIHRVTNIIQLRAMLQYCMKSVSILGDTSSDMGLSHFSARLHKLTGVLSKMNNFVADIALIQHQYQYAHRFLKTAYRGADNMTELDLDTARMFATITDDFKSFDTMLTSSKSASFFRLFGTVAARGVTAAENLRAMLGTAVESIHSNIQSAYDAFPRLSLLSYTSLNSFMAIWVVDPSEQADLMNSYMHQMFEGVGIVVIHKDIARRKVYCRGFVAHDKTEKVLFPEPILMSVALPDFLVSFEGALQTLLMEGCDSAFTARVQALRSLVQQVATEEILSCLSEVFKQRWSQLALCLSVDRPNQCFVLSNQCKFVEDIWLCLGQLSGSYLSSMAHADTEAFKPAWKKSLTCLLEVCTVNLDHFRNFLDPTYRLNTMQAIHDTMAAAAGNIGGNGARLTTQQQQMLANQSGPTILNSTKEYSLYASLFLQELSNVAVLKELLGCATLDVAVDLWASRYQLRYIQERSDRVKWSPFDITIGCSTVTHRMEYRGGYIKPSSDVRLEHVLHHVISSASYNKGSVFVLHDRTVGEEARVVDDAAQAAETLFDAKEEYAVSAQDVAHALGRILCPIASITSMQCARFFLSRLVFLDAVGCVDFTCIDFAGLQLLSNAMNSMISSLDKKDEYYLQESLKYPLKGRVMRNDYHTYRRNACVHALRDYRRKLTAGNCFKSTIVIGMGSDSIYSDVAVFEHFSRGLFSAVSVNNNQPAISSLKVMLSVKGYQFSGELQTSFLESVGNCMNYASTLLEKPGNELASKIIMEDVCKALTSSRVLSKIVNVAGELLVTTLMSAAFRNKQLLLTQLVGEYLSLALNSTSGPRGRRAQTPVGVSRESVSAMLELHLRLQTEVLCFTAVLWENVLMLLLQAGYLFPATPGATADRTNRKTPVGMDIPALKQQVCKAGQECLDRLPVAPAADLSSPAGANLAKKLKVDLVRAIGASEISVPGKMQTIIESVCASADVAPDACFVVQCVALWTMILQAPLSEQGILIGVNGASGSGKTTVREIVLRAMSKTSVKSFALLKQTCFCSSMVQKPLQAARIIVKAIAVFRKSRKLRKLSVRYKQQSALVYTAEEYRVRENCVHPRFGESFADAGDARVDGVFAHRLNTRGGFGPAVNGKPRATAKAAAKAKNSKAAPLFGRPDTDKADAPQTVHETQLVASSTIYHNSLTLETLIGTYDKDGMWKDGLLLRKLRSIEQVSSASVMAPEETNAVHAVVLDGVMGAHLEHVFLSSAYQEHNGLFGCTGNVNESRQRLVFPCGEVSRVPANTVLFIESGDTSHASPVLLSIIPHLHVSVSPESHIKRIIRLWIRNVSHCARRFSPWAGVVDELHSILQSDLVPSLVLSDMATGADGMGEDGLVNNNVALITSQLSTFLRILEDLLQECHELALDDGTHIEEVAADRDSSDDSDSSSESEEESENGDDESTVPSASVGEDNFSSFITSIDDVGSQSGVLDGKPLPKRVVGTGRGKAPPAMVFVLGTSGREKLMMRVKMSVMYAAIWGFGGVFNSTARRKFFESLARRTFDECVSDPLGEGYISLPFDCSVFELYLCLPQMSFVPASYRRSEQADSNAANGVGNYSVHLQAVEGSIPKDLHRHKVDIDIDLQAAKTTDTLVPSQVMDIVYLNPSQQAVSNALRSLLRAGGNAIVFGGHNAGKSFVINSLLTELRKNCPTPATMRKDIIGNLQSLICNHNSGSAAKGRGGGGAKAAATDDGAIPNTLKGVRRVLGSVEKHFKDGSFVNDDVTSYADHWADITQLSDEGGFLAGSQGKDARYHCGRQSVYSATVSMSSVLSADKMRDWLHREFKGEVADSLESPRYSHGVVFIDDVHLAAVREARLLSTEAGQDAVGAVSNRVEGLLKGLLAGTPLFGTLTQAGDFFEHHSTNGKVNSSVPEQLLLMQRAPGMPTLHCPHLSDPRQSGMSAASPALMDSCIVQPLGFVAAATGDFDSLVSLSNNSKSLLCDILPYMCSLSLPTTGFADVHAALIVSSFACMQQGNLLRVEAEMVGKKTTLIDSLKLNIVELCNFTLSIWSSMYKIIEVPGGSPPMAAMSAAERAQHMNFGSVERSITSACVPNLTTVTNFSKFLCAGSHSVTSKTDLLPLWLHEWHRLFLDPFPVECQQRQRIVGLIQSQLDGLDLEAWGMQSDDVRALTSKLQGLHSNIWLRTDVLHRGIIPPMGASYRPIELDLAATDRSIQAGTWDSDSSEFCKHGVSGSAVSVPTTAVMDGTSKNPNVILYPQAITLVMRIVRILSGSTGPDVRAGDDSSGRAKDPCTSFVLMGFPGGTRRTAVETAARVCGIPLMSFEVRDNAGVLGVHAASERLRNHCFKEFLKEVVWKAVGFSCMCPNTGPDSDMRVHIVSVPAQKVCMLISGVPMLRDADKRLLVTLLAGNSLPVDLFTDAEFCEMVESMRQDMRERNIEAAMALHALNHEAFTREQQQVRAEAEAAENPSPRRGSDALATPHLATETISSLQSGMQPPGRKDDLAALGGAVALSNLAAFSSHAPSRSGTITGYTYHWLKQYVCSRLRAHLSVILDADISRSYLVEPSFDISSGRGFSEAAAATANAQAASNAVDAAGGGAAGGSGKGRRQSRFSMVSSAAVPRRLSVLGAASAANDALGASCGSSSRRQSVMASAPGSTGGSARRTSVMSTSTSPSRRTSVLDTRRDSVNRRRSTVISVGGNVVRLSADGTATSAQSATAPTTLINTGRNVVSDFTSMSNRDYLSFVSCPILGPLISSACFNILWHDADGYDAATGVCNVLMRNVKLLSPDTGHPRFVNSGRTSPMVMFGLSKPIVSTVRPSPLPQLQARSESCHIVLKNDSSGQGGGTPSDNLFEVDVSTTILGAAQSPYSALFPHVSWYKSVGIAGSLSLLRRNWLIKQALEVQAANSASAASYQVASPKKAPPGSPASARKASVATPVARPQSPVKLDHLGPVSYMPATMLEGEIAAMKEEARSILPHLLTLKLPGIDNMLVTKPLLCLDMEHLAMVASEMVMSLLQDGAAVILQRQYTLSIARDALKQSLLTLDNAKSMHQTLAANNVEIMKATRKATAVVSSAQKDIEDFPSKAMEHETFRNTLRLQDEIAAAEQLVQNMTEAAEKYCTKFRTELKNFSDEQVAEFTKLLIGTKAAASDSGASEAAVAPSRYAVMLMRAIMLILNFAVVEKSTAKKKDKDKDKDAAPQIVVSVIDGGFPGATDETVAKYGAQLSSSGEFIQRVCAISPSAVERAGQLESLKYANAVLHTSMPDQEPPSAAAGERPFSDNMAEYIAPSILSISTDKGVVPHASMGAVYCCLRDFLQAVEVHCLTQSEVAQTRQRIAKLRADLAGAQDHHKQYRVSEEQELKEALVEAKEILHSVDEVGLDNKIKMDHLRRVSEDKERLATHCASSLAYVESELADIDAVLVCLVGDICVAAAVFARAASFREQIRQECMDAFRADLRLRLGVNRVSDSPYVLGSLVDRMQIRQWTSGHFESLPRDPASINAASLLYLSPMFTYVFDPEEVCEHVLPDLLPLHRLDHFKSDYELYTASAQGFSLAHLESWIDAAMTSRQSMDISLAIVVTDVQAGGSDDLVHFLAASLSLCPNGQQDAGPLLEQVDYSGLNRSGREKPCVSVDMSNGVEGRSRSFSSSRSAKLLLTNKLRVILLSTTLPTLDPLTNTCSPLPLCCFKHMHVLHWSVSGANVTDWYSENKPFYSHALNNVHAADFVFESKLVETLCAKLAPDLYSQLYVYNKMIIESTNEIYQLENNLVYALEHWHLQDELARGDSVSGAQQSAQLQAKLGYKLVSVHFGFIVDPNCVKVLSDSFAAKNQLQVEVEAWKSFEREIYGYQSCISGLFTMSVDLIRMVSVIVPSSHLTPYCLTAKNICGKGIGPLIQKSIPVRQSDPVESNTAGSKGGQKPKAAAASTENERNLLFVMQKIPPSLIGMSKLTRAVVKLQTSYRVKADRPIPVGRSVGSMKMQKEATNAIINIKLARVLSSKSRVALSGSADIKSRYLVRFGFDEVARKQLMLDLNVLLLPLKLPLFYCIVEYLINCVVPGYEHLIKLCVLLTTLMQPHSNGGSSSETRGLPLEEVRALVEIWRSSNAGVYNSDRVYYCNFYRMRKASSKAEVSPQKNPLLGAGSGARKARSRSNSENKEDDLTEDQFAPEVLPGVGTLSRRVTAYRPKFARASNAQPAFQSFGGFHAMVEASWRAIGPGRLDGVWISRKSTKWRIKSIPENSTGLIMESELNPGRASKPEKAAGFATVHSDIVSCDMLAPELLVKSRTAAARPYDSFMAEWLEILHGVKACSVHSFSSQSITSFARGGVASVGGGEEGNSVLEEIGLRNLHQELQRRRARVSTMFPVSRVDSARSSVDFQARPPVQTGISQRPSILKPAAFKLKKKDAIEEVVHSDTESDSDESEAHAERIQEKLAELKRSKAAAAQAKAKPKTDSSSFTTRVTRCSILSTSGLAPTDPRRQSIAKAPPPSRRDSLLKAPVVAVATSRLSVMMNGVGESSGRRLSALGGPSAANGHLGMLNSMKGGVHDDLDEEILPPAPHFKQLCALLENHHSLGRVFAGLTSVIFLKYDDEILEWKRALLATSALDVQALSAEELHELVIQLIPPIIDERDESDMSSSTTRAEAAHEGEGPTPAPARGQWMLGKELTILQTIILASVVAPGSVGKLIDVYLAMVTSFLQQDGILVGHPDELNVAAEDAASEAEEGEVSDGSSSSDDEESEKDDTFAKTVLPAHSLSTGGSGAPKRKHQEGVMVINSWSRLSNIIGGVTPARQARFSAKTSRYKLTCREYENWESVLLDIMTCFPSTQIDRYTYMRPLRDAVSGVNTNIFLSSPTARSALGGGKEDESGGSAQLILLSQRAKELSQYSNKNVPIFNSKLYESSDGAVSSAAKLAGFIDAVKTAALSNVQQRAIIQNIGLHSSAGNTLIAAILSAVNASTHSSLSIGTNAGNSSKTASAKPAHEAHKDIAESIEKALSRKEMTKNVIAKSYPLIISSHWQEHHMRSSFYYQVTGSIDSRSRSLKQYSRLSSAPFSFLGTMNYSWLPRFRCVDIISTSDSYFESPPEHRLSINESCGALYEELEGSLIWVINSFRLLTKTNLTSRIKNRFKFANKLESRLTSAIIAMFRMCMYVECKEREEGSSGIYPTASSLPVEWSKCVEPVSLWQLSRLMLHATNMINDAERFAEATQDSSGADVLENDEFRHGVALCSATLLEFLAGHVGLEEPARKRTSSKGKTGKPKKKSVDRGNASATKSKSAPAGGAQPHAPSRASIRVASAAPLNATVSSPRPPDSAFKPSNMVSARPSLVPTLPDDPPSGRGQESVAGTVAQNISLLAKMRHVDSLSLTSAESAATETGLTISNALRLHSMIGLFLAEITQKVLSDGIDKDARQSFLHGQKLSKYSRHSMTTTQYNRHSIAVGVATAPDDSFSPAADNRAIRRDTISMEHCNITVGGLSELETLNCIVRWTLDGMYSSNDSTPAVATSTTSSASAGGTAPHVAPRMTKQRRKFILGVLRKYILKEGGSGGGASAVATMLSNIVQDQGNARVLHV